LTTEAIRSVLDEARSIIRAGGTLPDPSELLPGSLIACRSGRHLGRAS